MGRYLGVQVKYGNFHLIVSKGRTRAAKKKKKKRQKAWSTINANTKIEI